MQPHPRLEQRLAEAFEGGPPPAVAQGVEALGGSSMKFGSGASTAGGAVASGIAWIGETGAGGGGNVGGGAGVDGGLEQRRSPPPSLARFVNPMPTRGFGRAPSVQRACPGPTYYLHRPEMHGLAQKENQCIRQYAAKQTNSAEK